MGYLQGGVSLRAPTTLLLDSSVRLVLEYANRDEQAFHDLRNVSVWPTWNPDREVASGTDISVAPTDSKRLLATGIGTPPGLGGREGFHLEFEVGAPSETGEMEYHHRYTDSPLSVPVAGTAQYDAVLCTAAAGDPAGPVRNFIQNWGFDIYLASGEREAHKRFTEFTDEPTCFVGVLPADGSEQGRQAVSTATSIALSRDVPAFVFAEDGVTHPHLPETQDCFVIECDLESERALTGHGGPGVLGVRRSIEAGTTERLLEQVRARAEQEPKEVLWAVVYPVLLERTGVTETVLDSLENSIELFINPAAGAAAESGPNTWPTFQGTDRSWDLVSEYDLSGTEFRITPFDVLDSKFLRISEDEYGDVIRNVSNDPPTVLTRIFTTE